MRIGMGFGLVYSVPGPGRPRTTWMKTIQQDLRSNDLSLDEAITVAQNRTDVCVWRYAPLVVHAAQEEEEEEPHYLATVRPRPFFGER